jgi:8-oxo-dGTP diphosphatase
MSRTTSAPTTRRRLSASPGGAGPGARAASNAAVGVAVDVVPCALLEGRPHAALIRVESGPETGRYAFPGGRVRAWESLDSGARRWLQQHLDSEGAYIEQLYTFGEPSRDPGARIVSVAYLALLASAVARPGVTWFPYDQLPELAYDHASVARIARERLRAKMTYTNIACNLLPESFSLSELQQIYETILGRKLDRRNFRKRVLGLGLLVPAGETRRGAHRPAQLYEFAERRPMVAEVLSAPLRG